MGFAKLFETYLGQILCKLDHSGEDSYEAEIRIYFEPPNLGVCDSAFHYESWEKADVDWAELGEEKAISIVESILSSLPNFEVYDELPNNQ